MKAKNRTILSLNDKEIDFIITQYSEGESTQNIAKILRLNQATVIRKLKKLGLHVKYKYPKLRKKQYTCNDYFFANIDNELKAYWLGFIAADGCITIDSRNRGYLKIGLASKDENHIEKFLKAMESNNPIKRRQNYNKKYKKYYDVSSIAISSKQLISDLINLGITPRKSLTLQYPVISDHLQKHFIRGYVDGDGCWSINKKKTCTYRPSLVFNVIGSHPFMQIFTKKINKITTKAKGYFRKKGNVSVFHLDASYASIEVANWIYENSNVCLDRKKAVVKKFIEMDNHFNRPRMKRYALPKCVLK